MDDKGMRLVGGDVEIGFTGHLDFPAAVGEGGREAEGAGGVEPDLGAVGEPELVEPAAGGTYLIIDDLRGGGVSWAIGQAAVVQFHDIGIPLAGQLAVTGVVEQDSRAAGEGVDGMLAAGGDVFDGVASAIIRVIAM